MSRLATALPFLAALLAGCSPEDQIVSYTVPKPPPVVRPQGMPTRPAPEADTRQPAGILGAIVPRGRQVWFFKITGSPDNVAAQVAPFAEFLKGVTFDGAAPRWSLPAGWVERPGNQFRLATLVIPGREGTEPLELAISALPARDGDFQDYLLENVNRWRDQLGLAALSRAELPDATLELPIDGGSAWLLSAKGTMAGAPMGAAPFAGARALPAQPEKSESAERNEKDSDDGQ